MIDLIRRLLVGLIALVFVVYGIFFSVSNMDTISVDVPLLHVYQVPAFVAYIAIFFLGFIVSALYLSLELFRKTILVRKLRKEVKGSKRESNKRSRNFLKEDAPETKPEPSIQSLEKDY